MTGVAPGAEIVTAEVFGPVLCLHTFAGEEEALAKANGTDYGLAAMMFTGDEDRAARVSGQLVAGTVWVNCFFVRDLRAPFGGARQLRCRPRGRHLVVRLLLRRQEQRLAPDGWG